MKRTSKSKSNGCICIGPSTHKETRLSFCSVRRERDAQAAKRFFLKTLTATHTSEPRVINVDKNAAYPKAFNELKTDGMMPEGCELRQVKYLNNLVEQDHHFIKRLVKPGLGFFSLLTAQRTPQGYERKKRNGVTDGA
jgi:transposase-like protein